MGGFGISIPCSQLWLLPSRRPRPCWHRQASAGHSWTVNVGRCSTGHCNQGCPSGEGGGTKGFGAPTETNVPGDALCFMVETWARQEATETVLNNGWRLVAVGRWWRLAVGSGPWRLPLWAVLKKHHSREGGGGFNPPSKPKAQLGPDRDATAADDISRKRRMALQLRSHWTTAGGLGVPQPRAVLK